MATKSSSSSTYYRKNLIKKQFFWNWLFRFDRLSQLIWYTNILGKSNQVFFISGTSRDWSRMAVTFALGQTYSICAHTKAKNMLRESAVTCKRYLDTCGSNNCECGCSRIVLGCNHWSGEITNTYL